MCQTRNEQGHRFCIACGTALSPSNASATPLTAPQPSVVEVAISQPLTEPSAAPEVSVAPSPPPIETPAAIAQRPATLTATPAFSHKGQVTALTLPDGVAAVAVAQQKSTQPLANTNHPIAAAPVVTLSEEPAAPAAPPSPCPRCQSLSEPGFQYCSVCGYLLQSKPTARPTPPAQAPTLPSAAETSPTGVLKPSTTPVDLSSTTGQYVANAPLKPMGRLVLLGKDGSDSTSYPLHGEVVDIGAREGLVQLPDDPYVSPRHARLQRDEGGRWLLVDLGSVNGVYLKLRAVRPLSDGDLILLGQQVLRFEAVMDAEQGLRPAMQHGTALFGTPQMARHARLCQRTVEGVTRDVFHLHRPETSLGREAADIVFSDDPFLSRRHAVIRVQQPTQAGAPRGFTIEDLGSSNGTFLALRGRESLQHGDVLRLGLHVFRFDLTADGERGAQL